MNRRGVDRNPHGGRRGVATSRSLKQLRVLDFIPANPQTRGGVSFLSLVGDEAPGVPPLRPLHIVHLDSRSVVGAKALGRLRMTRLPPPHPLLAPL
eukprot:1702841-Pyramimonas_sp.AAC.2